MADLLVAAGLGEAQLQSVQRALAGHRRALLLMAGLQLAGQDRHHRVVAQFVMVVQVLIAQSDGEHPLADQGPNLMLNERAVACIFEAAGEAIHQPDRAVGQAKKQGAGVRCDLPAVEGSHHRASFDRCKLEQFQATLCLHRGTPLRRVSICCRSIFPDSEPRCTYLSEIFGLTRPPQWRSSAPSKSDRPRRRRSG